MTHLGTLTLETQRLILRPLRSEDAQAVFDNWASDPEVTKFLTWPTHQSVDVTQRVIDGWVARYCRPDFYQWGIVLKPEAFDGSDGQPIGTISTVYGDDCIQMVEIGYCIGRKWWNKGITSEALRAVIAFLFEQVEVNRIEARHDPNNPHSGMVMAHCGMKFEGTLRQASRNNQGIVDSCCYSILRSEYLSD